MSDAFESRTPDVGQEARQIVAIGDGQADNVRLAATLNSLTERITDDAPGGYRVGELAEQLSGRGWFSCTSAGDVLEEAVDRFRDHEPKLIEAKADAIRAKAAVEAQVTTTQTVTEKTRAEADALRAEAVKKQAEVEQLQTQVGRVDEICKKLKARGIDWRAEIDGEGKMRVVVAKRLSAGAE